MVANDIRDVSRNYEERWPSGLRQQSTKIAMRKTASEVRIPSPFRQSSDALRDGKAIFFCRNAEGAMRER
jgi:hypothetical protein